MTSDTPEPGGRPGAIRAALFGLCPQCGGKTLFGGLAQFAPSCRSCGLDYSGFNVGDGPAAFLTLIVGIFVLALALRVEFAFHPPLWVHPLLWIPVTGGAVLLGLRVTKAWLLQAEYWRNAKEATGGDVSKDAE